MNIQPIFMILALLAVGCEPGPREQAFETLKEAVAAGVVGKEKWIPEFLPRSATDIRQICDFDTSENWITFNFSPDDTGLIEAACHSGLMDSVPLPKQYLAATIISWWPDWFTRGRYESIPPGYVILSCPRELRYASGRVERYTGYVAYEASEGHGYYWNLSH